jgi:hypothetical protein
MTIFIAEDFDLTRLRKVMNRLFDGTTMTFDDRRDLAYVIQSVLNEICERPISPTDLGPEIDEDPTPRDTTEEDANAAFNDRLDAHRREQ